MSKRKYITRTLSLLTVLAVITALVGCGGERTAKCESFHGFIGAGEAEEDYDFPIQG